MCRGTGALREGGREEGETDRQTEKLFSKWRNQQPTGTGKREVKSKIIWDTRA